MRRAAASLRADLLSPRRIVRHAHYRHHARQPEVSLPAYYWRLASATDAAGKPIAALQAGVEHQLRLSFTQDA